jgi:hypothetical protein
LGPLLICICLSLVIYVIPAMVFVKIFQDRFAHSAIVEVHTCAAMKSWPVDILCNVSYV